MKHLIKADFKKINYLSNDRNYLIALCVLSILFSLIFLFTIGVTQGKELWELSGLEVIDISLLGVDVTAIMLIIFTATFISKEFSNGAIHTSLAITPRRQKFYLSKVFFIMILSLVISLTLTLVIFGLDQFILLANNMELVSLGNQAVWFKLIGTAFMPLFYSLLSAAGTFYLRSAAGGIIFGMGAMFLPALIKLLPIRFSNMILPLLPEKSLHTITEMDTVVLNGQLMGALLTLLLWVLFSNILGLWILKRSDF